MTQKSKLLLDDRLLNLGREVVPDFVGWVGRVEQESRSRAGGFEHVDPVQKVELVASDEGGLFD